MPAASNQRRVGTIHVAPLVVAATEPATALTASGPTEKFAGETAGADRRSARPGRTKHPATTARQKMKRARGVGSGRSRAPASPARTRRSTCVLYATPFERDRSIIFVSR